MGRWCFCGCSNAIVVILNAGIMLTSLLVLSLWAMTARDLPKACNKFVQSPLLLLGAALLVVSLVGIIGACSHISVLLWFYLVTSLLVILGISCFTVFLFVVSNKGVAAAVSGHGVGGLRLGDYSGWLQRTVSDAGHWENIQKCLRGTGLCADLQDVPEKYTVLNRTTLFPVQEGCCLKPQGCNPTHPQGDCALWGEKPDVRCFFCDSCKAGLLANIRLEWKAVAILNISLVSFLVLVYFFGCCALSSSRQDKYNRYRRTQRPAGGFATVVA